MSILRRPQTEDPSGNRQLTNELELRYKHVLDEAEGTMISRLISGEEFDFNELVAAMMLTLGHMSRLTEASMRRGIFRSAEELKLVSPTFKADNMEWLPTDTIKLASNVEEHISDITKALNELNNSLRNPTITKVQRAFRVARSKTEMIARTKLMDVYNDTTRERYKRWGFKRYSFHAHLTACRDAKKLSDGTWAQEGCSGLHEKTFSINDKAHLPPIHPYCRCTILPVMG